MSIELAKQNFVNLKKVASDTVESKGLGNQKARVALALDISGSMSGLFANGTVQSVCEKLLALGVKFDDNKAIDIFLFGQKDYEVGELEENDFYQYVDKHITRKYSLEGSTIYSGVMKRIIKKYSDADNGQKQGLFKGLFNKKSTSNNEPIEPVYVMFVTDGDNYDKTEAEQVIKDSSNLGIFWQFVGLGGSSFNFLEKLDNLNGRVLDNTNFFHLNDFNKIDDSELYNRLLNEFPSWIKEAQSKGFIN